MFMISTAIPSLALSADITARRLAQTHQELLLRELSHRVGNTLAVLSSVFRRSALHARSIAELKESFEGRLMNLATTNRLLSNANWQSASLKELVQAAVEPYCAPEYNGCEFTGIELRIPGSIVTSLTMVLHELAVNAVKHGALKLRDGKLTVAWQVEDVPAAPLLKIAWEEMASAAYTPGSHGYGTGLIDTTIASLGGVVQREHKDGFFVVRFTIPLGGEPRRH
jgi:two-component sensor histidine kinase